MGKAWRGNSCHSWLAASGRIQKHCLASSRHLPKEAKTLLGSCGDVIQHWRARAVQDMIRITVQPESQVVMEGTRVSLTCWATGPLGLAYQWFCGKCEVRSCSAPELVVDTAALPGQPEWYICRVNCGAAFAFSRWAHVRVEKSSSPTCSQRLLPDHGGAADPAAAAALPSGRGGHADLERRAIGNPPPQYQWFRSPRRFASGGSWQEGDGGSPEHGSPGQLYATDKVALLIGNMHYLHHKQLKAPMVDVHALSALLRQLDFKVVSLLDLCKAEMQMAVNEFLLLLDKGVYGLLYYAGHGYENFGNSFMVPIDAPSSYTSAHCLCVQRVLQSMQQRHTGLNIFLLDMCRKR
ncbi:PREDICTED: LOW QUALITY PROTEIN: mucosa-associated lymphoid tissue lymphoma translocation protein 1 homolog [Pygoscelis adeliae]|uniref:LOW QUALITY PROTEIN: mucosa-associated lymphoid tissue lymphoma translocation protein 1 homolog n=1 Tax=Pygoscelis adeliae TaxID=9238 RepID=UPI0004F4F74C|nr:PREDICTED: LOW QUALITY PROTEIN: mucosa-associated lymphoid tissue lymphoma translocation protein 1 homolog [Pygoscelis adeliae]